MSPLIFNDSKSAENTLSALSASSHIVYAGIYNTKGDFFAGYWREGGDQSLPLPPYALGQTERHWFESGQFALMQTIMFQGKPVGIVYIRSDIAAIKTRLRSYAIILLAILLLL